MTSPRATDARDVPEANRRKGRNQLTNTMKKYCVHVYKTESGFVEIEAESISQAVELGLSKGDDEGVDWDDTKIGVDNVSEIYLKHQHIR